MISIIVPIFNTERYLCQCIDSILSQTYRDIEIICINDASPGNCMQILEKYAAKDPRIVIVNKEINEGIEKGRHTGIEKSKGQYLLFIDSDDWLEGDNTIELMYQKAIETDADYVEVNSQRVMDSRKWIKKVSPQAVCGTIEQPELFDEYYISFFGLNKLSVNIWGKLYKKETIMKVNPQPQGFKMGEDQIFNLQLFPFLRKIHIMNDVGYNYRFGGMTTHYNAKLFPDLKKLFLFKMPLLDMNNYQKAKIWSCLEMKNVLKADVCQRIRFKIGNEGTTIDWIDKELQDEMWDDIISIIDNSKFSNGDLFRALKEKNSKALYRFCQEENNRLFLGYWTKRVLSFALSIIN